MNTDLLKVSLRQQAVCLPLISPSSVVSASAVAFTATLRDLGYTVSEPLLHALSSLSDSELSTISATIGEALGSHLNWAPLVKGWQKPTGESLADHFFTYIANALPTGMQPKGVRLPCGHLIPEGTFPIERYNGCPFCGRQFTTVEGTFLGQGSKLKTLQLWGEAEAEAYFRSLLSSPVALDATQRDSLRLLLSIYEVADDTVITIKETRMLVADTLIEHGRDEQASKLFSTPADILRYLWWRHTGQIQVIAPHILLYNARKNSRHLSPWLDQSDEAEADMQQRLRLKYDRRWCRRVALWLNSLPTPLPAQLESMHPKRGMWVRMIRALRLTEYARREGFDQLRELLDAFYNTRYEVLQGRIDHARETRDEQGVLGLLKQRPGLFARCLFSTMLRYDHRHVVEAFSEVALQLPMRLILTLDMQADQWFDSTANRVARPITGLMKLIPAHPLLKQLPPSEQQAMAASVHNICRQALMRHFALLPTEAKTIYIDPQLDNIPLSIGDRSATIQDASCALQGTRFPVEGEKVRLFLQWGEGLPAQHLDMDLSAYMLTDSESYQCAYFNLTVEGAQHSGDIREIPDLVGTAEYVELDLNELRERGVRRVVFTCNAYSNGALEPNLRVGWMQSSNPMQVSDETGVAYDPSTVQHIVRISAPNLSKGLIFGVLDIANHEITWLEMPFDGQTVMSITPETIEAYLNRLARKTTVAALLRTKAEAQHLTIVANPSEADESYTYEWLLCGGASSLL